MVLIMHLSVSLTGVKPLIYLTWVKIAPLSSENYPALGTSLLALWLRLYAPIAGGLGSIPGQGTGSYVPPNKYFQKGENDPTPERPREQRVCEPLEDLRLLFEKGKY